jgi:hypothetical protein
MAISGLQSLGGIPLRDRPQAAVVPALGIGLQPLFGGARGRVRQHRPMLDRIRGWLRSGGGADWSVRLPSWPT